MDYGAKYIRWAPFADENPEPDGTLPNYGLAVSLGALNKVNENITFNEAKGYGDNALKAYANKFKEAVLAIEVTTIPRASMTAVSGAEIEPGEHKNMWFGDNDKPPYGGLCYFINILTDEGKDMCRGIFYPKTKAMLQGNEYNTNGENITLSTGKLQFTASSCKIGKWRGYSEDFETETEAKAWVDGMFTGVSTMLSAKSEVQGSGGQGGGEEEESV